MHKRDSTPQQHGPCKGGPKHKRLSQSPPGWSVARTTAPLARGRESSRLDFDPIKDCRGPSPVSTCHHDDHDDPETRSCHRRRSTQQDSPVTLPPLRVPLSFAQHGAARLPCRLRGHHGFEIRQRVKWTPRRGREDLWGSRRRGGPPFHCPDSHASPTVTGLSSLPLPWLPGWTWWTTGGTILETFVFRPIPGPGDGGQPCEVVASL